MSEPNNYCFTDDDGEEDDEGEDDDEDDDGEGKGTFRLNSGTSIL